MYRISAALLACACISSVYAQEIAYRDAVEQLDALLQDIETLTADVVQLIVESDGGILEESEIQLYLKKPNGFYWETLTPFPELVVTNGIKLWNYQPDLEQVVIEDWDTGRSELAAQLLNGETENLAEEYRIELVSAEGSTDHEFSLIPWANESIYTQISINFSGTELDLIYLENKNGQQTVWRFDSVERNLPLADSLFEFTPPSGIEIIENRYVQ
ncbi:MAG: outer membrane lipoprotein chaperone LolA [Proteobacteria bacterium]|nr:outer membrane lipoprotein chaperone LolA [Pseudomonadota bacterium]